VEGHFQVDRDAVPPSLRLRSPRTNNKGDAQKLERQGACQTNLTGFWKQTCIHCFVSLQKF
jgi:hypothetical protein